jgi:hypothetical protein
VYPITGCIINKENRVIVVSIDTLKELITNGIREALPEKKPTASRLYTKEPG